MITGSSQRLPWTLAVPIPSATSGSFPKDRRTLYRALAVIVALAALTPLFADLETDHTQGNLKHPKGGSSANSSPVSLSPRAAFHRCNLWQDY